MTPTARKSSILIFSIFTLCLIFPFTSLAAEYVTVIKDGVNVRSQPSTKSEVFWEVFENFPLKVLERKGDWVKAEDFEGDTGWIYGPLLSKKKKVIVKVKKANLRVGPGKNYEITATALYGVVFTPGRHDGKWVQVTHADGTKGWVHSSLIWP
jgi:SH3-like domain-containing protein